MKEPAKSGLFTLEEEEEAAERRRSWGISSSPSPSGSEDELATPAYERADPFDMPMDVDEVEVDIEVHTPVDVPASIPFLRSSPTLGSSLTTTSFRPRRPPPLNLSVITDPFAFTPQYTPTNSKHQLLPALPILSPEDYATSRRLDLDAVFEDLLETCGESISAFPMPPPRSPDTPVLQTPTTPPPRHRLQCPGAPGPKARARSTSKPQLKGLGLGLGTSMGMGMGGDHSFLYSLSNSSDSGSSDSPSSRSSSSTRSRGKSLPKRNHLPSHWTDNVI